MASETESMTPAQAAEVLQGLGDYEERLTRRAHGMTLMVWGLVASAIFLAYGAAGSYFHMHGWEWAFWILWAPFVAVGVLVSAGIWKTQSISLGKTEDGQVKYTLLGLVLLFAGAGFIFLILDVWLAFSWTISTIMLIASGAFALDLAIIHRMFHKRWDWAVLGAGAVMLFVGIDLGFFGADRMASSLTSAFTALFAWCGAGYLNYRRG